MATALTTKIIMSNTPKSFDSSDESGKIDIQRGQLTLPFTQDQFRDFISGLFGTPDSMSSQLGGPLNVELGDLRTVNTVIEERIREQNKGLLAQFTANIRYDDGSSEVLQFDSFFNLNEFIPRIPRIINLTWQYLIKFENKDVPEKQEISITISTGGRIDSPEYRFTNNQAILEIKYTSRSWAFDMESTISNYFKSLVMPTKRRNRLIILLSSNNALTGWIGGIIFFLLSCIGGAFSANRFENHQINSFKEFVSTDPNPNQQIFFLVNLLTSEGAARFYFFLAIFLLVMIVFAAIAGIFITDAITLKSERNHILLTRLAREEMNKEKKAGRKKFITFIKTSIFAICINLISSFIFITFMS